MMRGFFLSFIFIALHLIAVGQTKQEIEELYKDANSYFYFEDYEEAVALYQKVLPHYENNYNLNYKIGICYLNIQGHKHQAIPFLEFATKGISKRFNEFSTKETQAPVDVFFYLANAYFINNQLGKAQETYEEFKSHIKRESQYNMEYLNHQLNTLKNSRVLQSYPVNFIRSNFGKNVNDRFSNFNPVISGDGKTMAFTSKRKFYQAIHILRKDESDSWGIPMNITLDLMVDGNCSTLSLSYDGTELFLFKDDNHDGNIYVSSFNGTSWSPMKKLNENINTNYYETHACISADGRSLFFTSNRNGGFGDLDIYLSNREPGADWGPAQNLGPAINTSFNENTPFITTDGTTLFFSSEGHNTLGGYDIFFSQKKEDNSWSKPINLGYPINTTDDNLFYFPVNDGSIGLTALFDNDGYGDMDIYEIEIFLPRYQKAIVSATDLYTRSTELPKKTLVIDTINSPGFALVDPSKPTHMQYISTDKKFKIFFEGKGFNMRDQAKMTQKIIPTTPSATAEKIEVTKQPLAEITVENPKDSLLHQVLKNLPPVKNMETIAEQELNSAIKPQEQKTDSTKFEVKTYTETELEAKAREVEIISNLLIAIADESVKPLIEDAIFRSWQVPPSLLMLQTTRLAIAADSLGLSEQFLEIFTKLLDIITQNNENPSIHSRQIASKEQNERFFYTLQQIKKGATAGLSQLIDNAIISDPSINNFESLWKYLSQNSNGEIEQYIPELLSLLAKHSVEEYFKLSELQKELVYKQATSQKLNNKSWLIIAVSILTFSFISIILLIRRKKRKGRKVNEPRKADAGK